MHLPRPPSRRLPTPQVALLLVGLTFYPPVIAGAAPPQPTPQADLQKIFSGGVPSSVAELRAMEQHQQQLADRLLACTVGVIVGPAHGSGVIINEDGTVLTAAHVAGKPGLRAIIILADGRRVSGKTLGVFRTLDAGMLKITSEGTWPHAELSPEPEVVRGQWVIATGHPGGVQSGRRPAVRIGRVSLNDRTAITTDCTLIGGDSGGPLFDMQGRVVGVNSRIGRNLAANLHVPVAAYRDNWDRLVAGESWGHFPGTGPYIGVEGAEDSDIARIATVRAGTPAARAGIRAGDVILAFDGKPVSDFPSLQARVLDSDPGDRVRVKIRRGDAEMELELIVGRRDS